MDKLRIATRKGLFFYHREGTRWVMSREPAFLAEPVTYALTDPRDGAIYVALAHGHFGVKLHRSDDDGVTWQELPVPACPPSDEPDAPAVELIWSLVPGGNDRPGTLWCGTIPGGLFVSRDKGASWQINEPMWNQPSRPGWFGGGYDHAGIHSIMVDPRDSDHILIGISCAGSWRTRDGGQNWTVVGKGMMAEYLPPEKWDDPVGQDPHLMAAAPTNPDRIWCQHHCGIYVSDDGGATFEVIPKAGPSTFGFTVAAHPTKPDTAWFVPAIRDAYRVPVDGKFVVTRTDDGGKTFKVLNRGLPEQSWDLVYRHGLAVDDTGERLVMGSTTGNVWTSDDGGESWVMLSSHLPPVVQVAFA